MRSTSEPLVSIVTPVYNEAVYLGECIESVLAQRYQNWDYTIVDNCSTDGSFEVARQYAAKDKRIRVLRNREFVPAIANHNVAIRQISPYSKYCKVLLGDDWLFPNCLSEMVAAAEENPSIGVVGSYGLQGQRVMWTGLEYPSRFMPGRDICRRLFIDNLYVFGSPTSVLYRADLVRSHVPFYNEANIHADMESCIVLLKKSDFGFVHQVLTFGRLRPGSLMTMSARLNTYVAANLYHLVRHGPEFLTPEEFKICVNNQIWQYYRTIVGGLVRGRGRMFLSFHQKQMIEAGVGFSWMRLGRAALWSAIGAFGNPKSSFRAVRELRRSASARGVNRDSCE